MIQLQAVKGNGDGVWCGGLAGLCASLSEISVSTRVTAFYIGTSYSIVTVILFSNYFSVRG